MSARAQKIVKEALALSPAERAKVIAALLASIDHRPPVDDTWTDELQRRADLAVSGRSGAAPWSVVRARVKKAIKRG